MDINSFPKGKISYKVTTNILLALSIILFISVTIITLFMNSFYDNQKKYLEDKLSRLFVSLVAPNLERYDYFGVEKSCQEFLSEEIVNYVYIFDNNGFLINQSYYEKINTSSNLIEEIKIDIENSHNFKIGEAKIGYNFKNYYFSLLKVKIILFVNILLIIAFSNLLILYILNKNLSFPLFQLLNFINQISKGDYSSKLKFNSDDEIGQISKAFNEMLDKLNYNISLIEGIVKSLPSAIIFIDGQFKVNLWNIAAEKLFKKNASDVLQKNIFEIDTYFLELENDILEVFKNYQFKSINQKLIEKANFNGRYHTINLIPFLANAEKETLNGVIIKIDDETENVKNFSILTQMQKMESIRLLSSGIAHDFNNILGSITGTISLIEDDVKKGITSKKEIEDYIEILKLSTQKAKLVVNQLMSLSKKQTVQFDVVNVSNCINDIIKICEHSFDKSVEIIYDNKIKEAFVWGIESQIEQALLNLCINGYHAMTIMKKEDEVRGGVLTLSLQNEKREDKEYWKILVKDNGVGIPKENLRKIFDPFFSTKDKATSSGLGLALVYNIIENHGGFIEVDSTVGIGTTMKVFLPVYKIDLVKKESENISKKNKINFDGKKVLIIEDDQTLQDVFNKILTKLGFEIFQISDASSILDTFEKLKDNIDLLVLDLIMPKISGFEIFNLLEEKYKIVEKNLHVILTTGLAMDERVEKLSKYKNVNILPKPFTMKDISEILEDLFLES